MPESPLFPGLKTLIQGPEPSFGPIHLTRQNIYLLPSKFGWIYLLIFLGMLLGAVNYANNLAYAMAFMIASVGLISILHTYRNLAGLSLTPVPAEPVFAGQSICFKLIIQESRGRMRSGLWLKKDRQWSAVPPVAPHKRASARIRLPTSHRGLLHLGRFNLITFYPLGLVKAWSRFNLKTSGLVYPQPAVEPTELFFAPEDAGSDPNPVFQISGLEDFQDLKDYHPGESYKRISWKAYAREQGLLVKRFTSGSGRSVWFDFEALSPPDPEIRLSILCALILEAQRIGAVYGLVLPEQRIGPGSGREHEQVCLQALALFKSP